jgi:hypothetical protein
MERINPRWFYSINMYALRVKQTELQSTLISSGVIPTSSRELCQSARSLQKFIVVEETMYYILNMLICIGMILLDNLL